MRGKVQASRQILVIDGHPDPAPDHLVHALADACTRGGRRAGHKVRRVNIADMNFPILRSNSAWRADPVGHDIRHSQEAIKWAEHMILLYPLWLGDVPALLKAFLEQALRPGFALREGAPPDQAAMLGGRSARLIVTMGMPAAVYRQHFGEHSLKSLEHNVLGFVGIDPISWTLIDNVEHDHSDGTDWLRLAERLGAEAN
jgi:putative NADPH-quinone reductase